MLLRYDSTLKQRYSHDISRVKSSEFASKAIVIAN